ncbi:MAG: NYN domain-containing protein [Ilumatobacteraceae bacterium]
MIDPTPDAAPPTRVADVVGVADSMLRSALELAVVLAAEGQKIRPPLVVPAGLKPYFKSHRLDSAGLRAVRRVIAADHEFRERLALIDMSELVDELGTVWLRRPDGWEATVQQLVAAAQQRAADETAAAALRKSEKRREAAEVVSARAQAELLGRHDALAREISRREKAEDAERAATRRAEALRDDVVGLQRENERLRNQVAEASMRADRSAAETEMITAQLLDVERVRDALLSRRHDSDVRQAALAEAPPAIALPDPDEVAREASAAAATAASAAELADARARNDAAAAVLHTAATANRDLAEALSAAHDALTSSTTNRLTPPRRTSLADSHEKNSPPNAARAPAAGLGDVRPLRRGPHRRQPIPIPGGLHGDSHAAAEHLLRTPDVCVIVDGYNVAKQAWPQLDLIDQRECCIVLLEDMSRRIGTDIRVIFDGAEVIGASSPRRRLVRVQFSPPGVSADDVIRGAVRSMPLQVPAVVVTNDRAIVSDVRAVGANVISTDTLLAVAGRSPSR